MDKKCSESIVAHGEKWCCCLLLGHEGAHTAYNDIDGIKFSVVEWGVDVSEQNISDLRYGG